MRLLVTGANGLVGSALIAAASQQGHDVLGTYHSTTPAFDIELEQHDIREWPPDLAAEEIDCVVNCAAMTDVDGCEEEPQRARAINAVAPGAIADHCSPETRVVHLSTDYVFDGRAETPYTEPAETNPLQVYGESKLAGERAVRDCAAAPLILRLSFVYGRHGATENLAGFPAWLLDTLGNGDSVPLFTDQYVTPSRAGQVATTILGLLDADVSGTYHVASRSCVTPHEFGMILADRFEQDASLIESGSQDEVDRPGTRPRYTCLATDRVEATLDRPQPSLADDIDCLCRTL
jgi:dTDP-4-dehydrorhamnose reductase